MLFELKETMNGMMLQVFADDKEISFHDLIAIANQMSCKLKAEGFEMKLPDKPSGDAKG